MINFKYLQSAKEELLDKFYSLVPEGEKVYYRGVSIGEAFVKQVEEASSYDKLADLYLMLEKMERDLASLSRKYLIKAANLEHILKLESSPRFEVRLAGEYLHLYYRTVKLQKFLDNHECTPILYDQYNVMKTYLNILEDRLKEYHISCSLSDDFNWGEENEKDL